MGYISAVEGGSSQVSTAAGNGMKYLAFQAFPASFGFRGGSTLSVRSGFLGMSCLDVTPKKLGDAVLGLAIVLWPRYGSKFSGRVRGHG
jgi:hypothetical protein